MNKYLLGGLCGALSALVIDLNAYSRSDKADGYSWL